MASTSPSPSTPIAFSSTCACSAISYTSRSLPSELSNCHCATCRKIAGAPFMTMFSLPITDITWTSRRPAALKTFRATERAERAHCGECGSTIWFKTQGTEGMEGSIMLSAGMIEEGSVRGGELPKGGRHIFCAVGERAGWEELGGDGVRGEMVA